MLSLQQVPQYFILFNNLKVYNLLSKLRMFAIQQQLTDYLLSANRTEILAENIRQTFVHNPYFQVLSIFERFDKFRKGYLVPADFSEFMLENKIYPTQSELYLIFRDFDRHRIGRVNLDQFQQQLLPRENRKLRKQALKRNPYPVQLKLSVDLEYLLGKYFQNKIKTIKQLLIITDRIKGIKQFAIDDCFLQLDAHQIGYLQSQQEIDRFLRKNGKALTNEELIRIYRVLSFHIERQVTLQMFRENLCPFDLPLYPCYIDKIREKEALQQTFLAKKYEATIENRQNILKREQLQHEIASLRDSNQRLQGIIQEQQLTKLSDYRTYYPSYYP